MCGDLSICGFWRGSADRRRRRASLTAKAAALGFNTDKLILMSTSDIQTINKSVIMAFAGICCGSFWRRVLRPGWLDTSGPAALLHRRRHTVRHGRVPDRGIRGLPFRGELVDARCWGEKRISGTGLANFLGSYWRVCDMIAPRLPASVVAFALVFPSFRHRPFQVACICFAPLGKGRSRGKWRGADEIGGGSRSKVDEVG